MTVTPLPWVKLTTAAVTLRVDSNARSQENRITHSHSNVQQTADSVSCSFIPYSSCKIKIFPMCKSESTVSSVATVGLVFEDLSLFGSHQKRMNLSRFSRVSTLPLLQERSWLSWDRLGSGKSTLLDVLSWSEDSWQSSDQGWLSLLSRIRRTNLIHSLESWPSKRCSVIWPSWNYPAVSQLRNARPSSWRSFSDAQIWNLVDTSSFEVLSTVEKSPVDKPNVSTLA